MLSHFRWPQLRPSRSEAQISFLARMKSLKPPLQMLLSRSITRDRGDRFWPIGKGDDDPDDRTPDDVHAKQVAALRLVGATSADLPSLEELRPFLAKKWHPWRRQRRLARPGATYLAGSAPHGRRRERGRWPGRRRPRLGRRAADDQIPHRYRRPHRLHDQAEHPARLPYPGRDRQRLQRVDPGKVGVPLRLLQGVDPLPAQDPETSAAEVLRHGQSPRHGPGADGERRAHPHGTRVCWPIYALPSSTTCRWPSTWAPRAPASPTTPTAVGYPATYLGFHTDHSQTMMAHCISLLAERCLRGAADMKFAFIEGGTVWAPSVMGRLDHALSRAEGRGALPDHAAERVSAAPLLFQHAADREPGDHAAPCSRCCG